MSSQVQPWHLMISVIIILTVAACARDTPSTLTYQRFDTALSQALSAPTKTQKVAALLSLGDTAFEATPRQTQALKEIVYALDRLGAKPVSTERDPVNQWRRDAVTNSQDETPPFRGRLLGPAYLSGEISAGKPYSLEQLFVAGQTANVAVSAPVKANTVKLTIQKRSGETICDVSAAKIQQCNWVPLFTERFTIGIENQEQTSTKFFLTID